MPDRLIVPAIVIVITCLTGNHAMRAAENNPDAPAVGMYDVFEVILSSDASFADPFVDGKAGATFTSPAGRKVEIPGFYYGDAKWMVRFAPNETGLWKYNARLEGGPMPVTTAGTFLCTPSKHHGFLRVSKVNPYRFQYEDGTPFYPIGIHLTSGLNPDFDGPGDDGGWRTVDQETWCKAFQDAVNLHRLQLGLGDQRGCAIPVLKGIENGRVTYNLDAAANIDDLYRTQRKYGLSQILILYQDMSLWGNADTPSGMGRDTTNFKSLRAKNLPLQENYIRYIVARYGAFEDVWEIYNEDGYSPDDYLAHLAGVIRKADPYHHIITTTYEQPTAPWCDLVTPHEYMGIPAKDVDAYLCTQLLRFKSFGKPVLYTEFGNQGILPNVDPIKWRIATWTAFMNECHILFWGTSGTKTTGRPDARGNANAYIGPEDRQYFRVLQDFTSDLPIDLRPIASGYTDQQHLRTYALGNRRIAVLYVHHFSDHQKPYTLPHQLFLATGPGRYTLRWIDPATGETVKQDKGETTGQFLKFNIPPVKIDLACRLDRQD